MVALIREFNTKSHSVKFRLSLDPYHGILRGLVLVSRGSVQSFMSVDAFKLFCFFYEIGNTTTIDTACFSLKDENTDVAISKIYDSRTKSERVRIVVSYEEEIKSDIRLPAREFKDSIEGIHEDMSSFLNNLAKGSIPDKYYSKMLDK
jgi:hypothetical protein